jgi:hypothetical protein
MEMVKGRRGNYAGLKRVDNVEDWGRNAAMSRYNSGKELSTPNMKPKDMTLPQDRQSRQAGFNDVPNSWRGSCADATKQPNFDHSRKR